MNRCQEAYELLSLGASQEAGLVLDFAIASIRQTLWAEEPETLIKLVGLLVNMFLLGRPEIALAVFRSVAGLGTSILGQQHPLPRISGCLLKLDRSCVVEASSKCLQVLADQFEKNLGPMHVISLYARWQVHLTSLDDMRKLLHRCQVELGVYDLRTMIVHLDLVTKLFRERHYCLARQICCDIISNARMVQPPSSNMEFRATIKFRIDGLIC